MAHSNCASVMQENDVSGGISGLRSPLRRCLMAAAATGIAVLTGAPAEAGSPIGELEHQYPCAADRRTIQLSHDYPNDPVTVGFRLEGGTPVLVVNESETFKQPIELVTFEYFSACEQARALIVEADSEKRLGDRSWVRDLVLRSDCQAISRMRREGLLRGSKGFMTILEVFNYERGGQAYRGIPFPDRSDNIRKNCSF